MAANAGATTMSCSPSALTSPTSVVSCNSPGPVGGPASASRKRLFGDDECAHLAADLPRITTRLCVGDRPIPTFQVDGKGFARITTRARWLIDALHVSHKVGLDMQLPTIVRLRNALADAKGKRLRGAWLADKSGNPLGGSIDVDINGHTVEVCTHGTQPAIVATDESVTWLLESLRDDLASDSPPPEDPAAIADCSEVAAADSASEDGDGDLEAVSLSADEIADLKAKGISYYPSRSSFVVKETLRPTSIALPQEFRCRRVRVSKRGPVSADDAVLSEMVVQQDRALHFRETGVKIVSPKLVKRT